MSKLKVGDRVVAENGTEVEILAIHDGRAWVVEDNCKSWIVWLGDLKRKPAEPEPLATVEKSRTSAGFKARIGSWHGYYWDTEESAKSDTARINAAAEEWFKRRLAAHVDALPEYGSWIHAKIKDSPVVSGQLDAFACEWAKGDA